MGKSTKNRRDLFKLGAGLAAVAVGWQLWVGREKPLVFEEIPGLPGWRRIAFDGVTGAGGSASEAIFAGLDPAETLAPLSPQALCSLLYPNVAKGIPAAIFTDVNCPNCASLEAKLKARRDILALNWHDLPLLGPTSENAARAMTAAGLQSADDDFRQRVLNTSSGRLVPAVLGNLAEETGLNAERLLKDMAGTKVDAALKQTRRAAQSLGVWGTPGFTIGRTFILGDVREDVLDRLIEEEASAGGC